MCIPPPFLFIVEKDDILLLYDEDRHQNLYLQYPKEALVLLKNLQNIALSKLNNNHNNNNIKSI
jgi:hypothetical protein